MLERVAGVDDVLDHQHVAAFDLAAQILEDAHLAARLRGVAVARDLEEIDFHRQVELTHQVGNEDERAAQQPHYHQLVGAGIVVRDLLGERLYPSRDRLGRDHLVDHVVPGRHAYFSAPWVSPRTKYLPPIRYTSSGGTIAIITVAAEPPARTPMIATVIGCCVPEVNTMP